MPERSIEERRIEPEDWDEPACRECGASAGKHLAVRSDEVELRGEISALDEPVDARITSYLLERQEAEEIRPHVPLEPGRGGDADPTICVVEERAGSVHRAKSRFRSRSPSATLRS